VELATAGLTSQLAGRPDFCVPRDAETDLDAIVRLLSQWGASLTRPTYPDRAILFEIRDLSQW